jgi:hypothetical protein
VGSIIGVLVYRALIPDPQAMLLTQEWPAPAVATWKAVAQTLISGLDSLSGDVRAAILFGGLAGLALGALDAIMPARRARYLPNAAALGLSFILPASVSIMMSFGAIMTWLISLRWSRLTHQFSIAVAAGFVAGESMTGVGASLWKLLQNARCQDNGQGARRLKHWKGRSLTTGHQLESARESRWHGACLAARNARPEPRRCLLRTAATVRPSPSCQCCSVQPWEQLLFFFTDMARQQGGKLLVLE